MSADFEDQFEDVVSFLNDHNVGTVSYIKNEKDESFINGLPMIGMGVYHLLWFMQKNLVKL